MKVVVQRVRNASVSIKGVTVSEINTGLLILVGIVPDDTQEDADWLVRKIAAMRIFPDENGVMNLSVLDIGGDILVVSQFTLAASVKKGNRPSYIGAARPETAIPLYDYFCQLMQNTLGREVKTGQFGADMQVSLVNDGPVTIIIDSKNIL